MREITVERALVRLVKSMGGMALKFVSPGMAGVPDRLVLLPGGRIAFVELKAPGRKPRPLQLLRHEQLRNLGFRVYVVDSPESMREVLDDMKKAPSDRLGDDTKTIVRGRSNVAETPCSPGAPSEIGGGTPGVTP